MEKSINQRVLEAREAYRAEHWKTADALLRCFTPYDGKCFARVRREDEDKKCVIDLERLGVSSLDSDPSLLYPVVVRTIDRITIWRTVATDRYEIPVKAERASHTQRAATEPLNQAHETWVEISNEEFEKFWRRTDDVVEALIREIEPAVREKS